jgi:dTDP-4-dehydrorhamnose 3,5-epimerase-like enzyme
MIKLINELGDARLITLPKHVDADGVLVVAEAAQIPFQIQRMFTIVAPAGAKRGRHAHRLCSQLVLCSSGAVDIACEDGRERKTFSFDRPDLALLVPSGLWLEIDVRQSEAVVTVLCDRPYEEPDYIRDYGEFLSFRKLARV